jgi:PAS domain S-box-containing protein
VVYWTADRSSAWAIWRFTTSPGGDHVTLGRPALAALTNGDDPGPRQAAISGADPSSVSEVRYQAIVEDQTELVCRFRPDCTLTFVNGAYCRYLGRPAEALVGRSLLELIPKHAWPAVQAHLASITPAHPAASVEHPITRPDGSLGWQHWVNRGFFSASGEVVEFQAVGRDVTDRKQAEEALRTSERRFREVLDHSRDLIYRVRLADLAFEYISPSCFDVSGFTQAEIITMGLAGIFRRVHPDDQAYIPTVMQRGPGPRIREWTAPNNDFRFRHRDGEYRWLHAVRAQVCDDNGTPVAGVGIIRDVTERHRADEELRGYRDRLEELVLERTAELARANERLQQELVERQRAEQNLRESEERFRQLAESIREIFWLTEPSSSRALYVSPAFEQVWGRRREEVYARAEVWLDAVEPEDRANVIKTIEDQVRGRSTDCEYRIQRPDGSIRWVRSRGFPVRNAAGEVYRVAGIAEDITERVRAEKLLVIQRDLGLALLSSASLAEALDTLLDATLRIDGIDCGGVYLVDEVNGELNLAVHRNLSSGFVAHVGHLPTGSRLSQLAMRGEARYWPRADIPVAPGFLEPEGLQVGACIPVQFDGRVIAALNLGSHTLAEIPEVTRHALETIAARVGSVIDRMQAKTALQESESRFRVLCSTAPVGIFIARRDGTNLYANPCLETLCGLKAEGTLDLGWLASVHPADRNVLREKIEEARRRGTDFRHEFRLLPPDGTERWVHVHTVSMGASGPEASLRVGIVQDITERRAGEEAERAARDYLAKIINCIADPIFVKDRQHRLVLVNDAECALAGRPREDVLGRTDYEFFPRAQVDVFWEKDEAVFETGQENINEEEITDASGRTRTIVTKKTRYTDRDGNQFIVGIIRDITERKQAEEAVHRHQEELAHAARLSTTGEMVSGLAHELAQPLSAILYFARSCITQLEHRRWGATEAQAAVTKIAAQAERASEFIHRLKSFVRKAQPRRVRSDLNAIVRDALALVTPQARGTCVAVQLDLDETIPQVLVDPIHVEQVVVNLVRNGIEALESVPLGGRKLHVQTQACLATVHFRVRDTGPGLTPSARAHLFDPFFTTKVNGTGLGLSISRTLIEEMHEGQLWVEAHPAGGVVSGFSLPAAAEVGHGRR